MWVYDFSCSFKLTKSELNLDRSLDSKRCLIVVSKTPFWCIIDSRFPFIVSISTFSFVSISMLSEIDFILTAIAFLSNLNFSIIWVLSFENVFTFVSSSISLFFDSFSLAMFSMMCETELSQSGQANSSIDLGA